MLFILGLSVFPFLMRIMALRVQTLLRGAQVLLTSAIIPNTLSTSGVPWPCMPVSIQAKYLITPGPYLLLNLCAAFARKSIAHAWHGFVSPYTQAPIRILKVIFKGRLHPFLFPICTCLFSSSAAPAPSFLSPLPPVKLLEWALLYFVVHSDLVNNIGVTP